ncbi:hypothetical protein JTE90_006427 [Oedothorax gibbosus]|uniref:DDE Tnp4 domain-containing protein n=1 Tax=Oedothorax gibbosus TaxID=931172 RepID=A0AAV6TZA1_9ARAC|nr:hypothetical protein JTE90_006427 [Oedothorax gibbosus]
MLRLRNGLTLDLIAYIFEISQPTASRYFNGMVECIYQKLQTVSIWPGREQVREFMPFNFRSYCPDCRVIIDCTEFKMVQPFNVVEQQLTFSHYKNSNTLKALIGIAPSGGVTFISDLYCGSISDKEFFKRSGLLQLLEKGDIVLADKGFRIEEELIEAEIGLMQPLFLKEKIQFTIEERSKNKLVSCLRVHVERAISRIKVFKYFEGSILYNSLHNINEVFFIASWLTNFNRPLITVEIAKFPEDLEESEDFTTDNGS